MKKEISCVQNTKKEENTMRYFDKIAQIWSDKNIGSGDIELSELVFFLDNIPKRGSILDIGCASAVHTYLFENYRYMGIDISSEMIKHASSKYPSKIFKRMNARDIENLNFRFDGIWCVRMLLHIEKNM